MLDNHKFFFSYWTSPFCEAEEFILNPSMDPYSAVNVRSLAFRVGKVSYRIRAYDRLTEGIAVGKNGLRTSCSRYDRYNTCYMYLRGARIDNYIIVEQHNTVWA